MQQGRAHRLRPYFYHPQKGVTVSSTRFQKETVSDRRVVYVVKTNGNYRGLS